MHAIANRFWATQSSATFTSPLWLTRSNLRTIVRMAYHPDERPVAIQIYGTDVPMMVEAAKMIEATGADIVDINCGCPAPKVVRRGGGAGLLKSLPLLGQIVDAVARAVAIPVTVKIRNGWCENSLNAHETLRVAQDNGAKALAIDTQIRAVLIIGLPGDDKTAIVEAGDNRASF